MAPPEERAISLTRWLQSALDSALFLHQETEAREGPAKMPRIHLAARMGYIEELRRMVDEQGADVMERNFMGETAKEMLEGFLDWMFDDDEEEYYDEGYPARVQEVIQFLSTKEIEQSSGI